LFFKNEFREGTYTPCWVLVTYKKYSKAFRFLAFGRIMMQQQPIFSAKNLVIKKIKSRSLHRATRSRKWLYMTAWANMTLILCLFMTALQINFQPVIL
jgi:hypothetical protein